MYDDAVKGKPARPKRFWTGNVPSQDDFGWLIENEFIDGKTATGPWAIMSPRIWRMHGCGKLGTGYGQRYRKQEDGRWLKVEG